MLQDLVMKPILKDGKLVVELHKPDVALLKRARELGLLLSLVDEGIGGPLVETINATLDACQYTLSDSTD